MPTINADDFALFQDQDATENKCAVASKPALPIVVVIDDDQNVRTALKAILNDKYQVILCPDGDQGIAAANACLSAVILDIKMHGKDGFQTFLEIKEKIFELPIIFYSAYQNLKDPYEIMNHYRPFGYLHKGGSQAELEDLIHSAVIYRQQVVKNTRLNQELLMANEQLRLAKDKALAGSTAKSNFLSTVSHELRTPLNQIIGYCEMLIEDVHINGTPKNLPEDLAVIKKASFQLLSLVTDILDITEADTGSISVDIGEVNLTSVLKDMENQYRIAAAVKHNTLLTKFDASLANTLTYFDEKLLRGILNNVLDNACKFTSQGQIKLAAKLETTPSGDWLVIAIEDDGIGMTTAQINTIFEPFYVADESTTRPNSGIGMGLAIVKIYCDALQGSIDVNSAPNKGTQFKLHLPYVNPQKPSTPAVLP